MKINITKKHYWNLIRALYMADWMANAICEADMKEDEEIKDVRNYFFSFAKEMGYEEYVEYDKELGKHYATFELDDEPSIRKLIERYDNHAFWDEIAERLGERDFFQKYTKDEIKKMSDDERFTKRIKCAIAWEEEFEKYGVERLGIIKKARKIKGVGY